VVGRAATYQGTASSGTQPGISVPLVLGWSSPTFSPVPMRSKTCAQGPACGQSNGRASSVLLFGSPALSRSARSQTNPPSGPAGGTPRNSRSSVLLPNDQNRLKGGTPKQQERFFPPCWSSPAFWPAAFCARVPRVWVLFARWRSAVCVEPIREQECTAAPPATGPGGPQPSKPS